MCLCLPGPASHLQQQEFKARTFSIKTPDKGGQSGAVQLGAPTATAANRLLAPSEAPQGFLLFPCPHLKH